MKNREWVALSCILGVVAGFALTSTGVNDQLAFAYWLVYAVTAGVVVNTAEGLSGGSLLLGSFPSPATMGLTALFRVLYQGVGFVSGHDVENDPSAAPFIGVLVLLTWAAIWVFSFARPAVLKVLRFVFGMPQARAKRFEARLNWVIKIAGLLTLLLHRFIG